MEESENLQKVRELLEEAQRFHKDNEWDQVIKVCDRASLLAENDLSITSSIKADIYYFRGIAHVMEYNYNLAINDIRKIKILIPYSYDAHRMLGYIYYLNGEHGKSLECYRKANSANPRLKVEDSLCYIASKIYSTKMLPHLVKLYEITVNIKRSRFYDRSKNSPIVSHYTNLNSLRSLIQKESFRFYNVVYMNDPTEGTTLLARLEKSELLNKDGETKVFLSESTRSPAFVGSFSSVGVDHWGDYGKHTSQGSDGACLHFDISQFSTRWPHELDTMLPEKSENSSAPSAPAQKAYIYEMAYEDDMKSEALSVELDKLPEILGKIRWDKWDNKNPDHLLAREILDEIRFLFKANEYQHEKELRILKIRHFDDELPEDIKVDSDKIPPRFYMEAPDQLRLQKVILGPKAKEFANWERWIKTANSELEVEQSTDHS